jgi:hypothetical protein
MTVVTVRDFRDRASEGFGEQRRNLGVERRSRPLARDLRGAPRAAEHSLQRGIARDVGDPQRQRHLRLRGAGERSLAVPAVGHVHEQASERVGHAEAPASISATSHIAVMCGLNARTAFGRRWTSCSARTGRGLDGLGSARTTRRTPRAGSRTSPALGAR